MKTTLKKIREHSPCETGWKKLLKNLGKKKADDEPVSIAFILESNGIDDALWCLRAVDGYQREMRLFAVDCARSAVHFTNDERSIAAIDVSERYADGLASEDERAAAWDAAMAAARAAAWDAARAAARAAARYAAWHAAWDAARYAARAAAWDDSGDDSGDAAWDAAWEIQSNLLAIVCAEIEQREQS